MTAPDGDDYTWDSSRLCSSHGLQELAAHDQGLDVRTWDQVEAERWAALEARLAGLEETVAKLRVSIEQLFEVKLP